MLPLARQVCFVEIINGTDGQCCKERLCPYIEIVKDPYIPKGISARTPFRVGVWGGSMQEVN